MRDARYVRDVLSLGGGEDEGGGEGEGEREREAGAKVGVSAHHAQGISYLKFGHRKSRAGRCA